jgi:TonB family protein
MFDKLIESSREGRRRPAGPYLLVASTFYFVALTAAACAAIMWFNPGLVEALELNARLATPPPMTASMPKPASVSISRAPTTVTSAIATETAVPRRISETLPIVVGADAAKTPAVVFQGRGRNVAGDGVLGVPDGANREGTAPPPPTREPAPPPTPVAAKATEKSIVSEGVLRGIATNRFTPPYPEIAKKAGIQGEVQVQVLIAEDGRVIEATVLSGNPLLRNTARDAAKRWVFTPTKLSGVPVKVQGILTFDFKLN